MNVSEPSVDLIDKSDFRITAVRDVADEMNLEDRDHILFFNDEAVSS